MANIIERTDYPLTSTSLAEKLRACGLEPGQTVLVHMAMSKLGTWPGVVRSAHPATSFAAILGRAYEIAYPVDVNHIGQAEVRLLEQRPLVDFGVAWIEEHRGSAV